MNEVEMKAYLTSSVQYWPVTWEETYLYINNQMQALQNAWEGNSEVANQVRLVINRISESGANESLALAYQIALFKNDKKLIEHVIDSYVEDCKIWVQWTSRGAHRIDGLVMNMKAQIDIEMRGLMELLLDTVRDARLSVGEV